MARPGSVHRGPRQASRKPRRRRRLLRLWPSAALRRRLWRAFARAPRPVQILIGLSIVVAVWLVLNWSYQVVRKPSELFFPVSGTLYKTPAETWRQYAPIFEKYSTAVITPELLAALAQVEGSGNPIVRTYWRWSWSPWPFEVYRPASSAVGMYQITDGTFAEARRYCIRHHSVVEDGPWNDWRSCWFNRFYTRVVPSHAVELTAAYLDHNVTSILERHRVNSATAQQKQDLAAVIHLCGAGAGEVYAGRGLKLLDAQRCGDHEVRGYIARVGAMQRVFTLLAAGHARM
jgi:hypothetical protein